MDPWFGAPASLKGSKLSGSRSVGIPNKRPRVGDLIWTFGSRRHGLQVP